MGGTQKGFYMSITRIKTDLFRVRVRRTSPNGQVKSRSELVHGTRQDARRTEVQFIDELDREPSSLKNTVKTVNDALDFYFSVQEEKRLNQQATITAINRLRTELGSVPLCDKRGYQDNFKRIFSNFWLSLNRTPSLRRPGQMLSGSHKNQCLKIMSRTLDLLMRHGHIKENCLYRQFERHDEHERDRFFFQEEIDFLLQTLLENKSYLYWPVRFSLTNPIRKEDLKDLQKTNLNMFKPWISFKPRKTQRRGPKITFLLELDEFMDYFNALPKDCDWLFPRPDYITGELRRLGNFQEHWQRMLAAAQAKSPDNFYEIHKDHYQMYPETPKFLKDVHWHDLKHYSITHYLDLGYDYVDLKNLGIEVSPHMIDRYHIKDADKALLRKNLDSKKREMALAVAS